MGKGDPVRKTKTHKPDIKLPMAGVLAAVVSQKEERLKAPIKGHRQPGHKKSYGEGAFGKCKYLTVKEK